MGHRARFHQLNPWNILSLPLSHLKYDLDYTLQNYIILLTPFLFFCFDYIKASLRVKKTKWRKTRQLFWKGTAEQKWNGECPEAGRREVKCGKKKEKAFRWRILVQPQNIITASSTASYAVSHPEINRNTDADMNAAAHTSMICGSIFNKLLFLMLMKQACTRRLAWAE